MRNRRTISRVLALVLVAAALACGQEAQSGKSHGVVRAVDARARSVTIEHGEIPGMMDAMTMSFDVAPGVSLEGISPGTEVDFEVEEQRGSYTLTQIVPFGS